MFSVNESSWIFSACKFFIIILSFLSLVIGPIVQQPVEHRLRADVSAEAVQPGEDPRESVAVRLVQLPVPRHPGQPYVPAGGVPRERGMRHVRRTEAAARARRRDVARAPARGRPVYLRCLQIPPTFQVLPKHSSCRYRFPCFSEKSNSSYKSWTSYITNIYNVFSKNELHKPKEKQVSNIVTKWCRQGDLTVFVSIVQEDHM